MRMQQGFFQFESLSAHFRNLGGNINVHMAKFSASNQLKRLRNNYRLVIMNEDTFEEVVRFRLSRLSVYIAMSSLFVILVALTSSLIIFTPLKYYLPGVGYGNAQQIREFRTLKLRTDSMEKALVQQLQYNENVGALLKGEQIKSDTTTIDIPDAVVQEMDGEQPIKSKARKKSRSKKRKRRR